jgi:beta-lactamase superfamily II metal-dependent hydrolase
MRPARHRTRTGIDKAQPLGSAVSFEEDRMSETSHRSTADRGGGDRVRIHFLDVGQEEYGDCVLCELGRTRVLIDGAHPGNQVGSSRHPSIPQQLRTVLGDDTSPVRVDLVVVTHAHQDHIGCLPFLVQHGMVAADWALVADPGLGWGRSDQPDSEPPRPDARVVPLIAGLREEVLDESADDETIARFLADAASLEQNYTSMLSTLAANGTRVVRHGRDRTTNITRAFRKIGLKVLGPTQAQLLICADRIAQTNTDAVAAVSDMMPRVDAAVSEPDLYRALVHGADSFDALSRPGPAINLQSIVTSFDFGGAKLLFAGDMQFANPQIADLRLDKELKQLHSRIHNEAPFDVVKLSHHGSDNAFDDALLQELGTTPLYGICAGEDSTSHPNPKVLRLLNSIRDRVTWVRTDHNGLATIELSGTPKLSLTRGELNDPRPNTPDAEAGARPAAAPAQPARTAERPKTVTSGATSEGSDVVEVITKVPGGVSHVAITIDVDRSQIARPQTAPDKSADVTIANGRRLAPLLFVTSAAALARNIGETESAQILSSLRRAGLDVYDSLPSDPSDPLRSPELVREQLATRPELQGVVLIGGYDAVPPLRLDCLPPELRRTLGQTDDADDFIVWSDDAYGDQDGDRIAELPVSRIPDGKSADLLRLALGADDAPRYASRRGVRNVARPFAEPIFAGLPGAEPLSVSQPTTSEQVPPLDGDLVYLMLHGDYLDSSRFWGEATPNNREAVNVSNVPTRAARIVFTGCCWGALVADQPALRSAPGSAPAAKVAESSIALTFLQAGATAFIGCTGAHYSPTEPPYDYFGGPMHTAFWKGILARKPPAQALFDAKVDYVSGFPHGRSSPVQQAIEYKILRQYTCLGLGW